MFNHLTVDAYGEKMGLAQCGQCTLQSERQMLINVFDPSVGRHRRRCRAAEGRASASRPQFTRAPGSRAHLESPAPPPCLLCSRQLGSAVQKALLEAELDLNPSLEGSTVKVPIPK